LDLQEHAKILRSTQKGNISRILFMWP